MEAILNFLINGVLASIVGSVILIVIGGFFSHSLRWLLTGILGRLLDIDIEYVFRSKSDADKDILKELDKASFVYIMTGRGIDIQRGLFDKVLSRKLRRKSSDIRIMLPLPQSSSSIPDWINQRENELARFDPAFGRGALRDQIKMTIKYLENFLINGDIELRLFEFPHIGRIIITDRVIFFTPYSAHAHGKDCRVIKHRRSSDFYDCFLRLFNQVWDVSEKT